MVDVDSRAAAARRCLRKFVQRLFRIIQHAQQHRQIEAGDAPHTQSDRMQSLCDITRCRSINIREHQHAIAAIKCANARGRVAQRDIDIGTGRHGEGIERQ